MITSLQLTNFKCFKETTKFNFSKLNLLTGINGRGKSTVLQSLLILSQSATSNSNFKELKISDGFIDLGNFDDIKNRDTVKGENIIFDYTFNDNFLKNISLSFKENLDKPLIGNLNNEIDSSDLEMFSTKIKKTHYVSADRMGPVKFVEKTNLPDFPHVGPRGEHSINILANSIQFDNVNENLYLGEDSSSIIQQTTEWINYILEGAKINIKGKEKDSSVLYMLLNNKSDSHEYKPVNVGFGYSYILPLIITGLIAKPNDIIIIENPEAHLHPRAQSKIAEFFSKVAATGVQIFIESHSEHILNGLRVNALNKNVAINHTDLKVHYFSEDFNSIELEMNEKGKISNWPNGFFDQQEIDLADIFKFSR
jgi:predicted ATPase